MVQILTGTNDVYPGWVLCGGSAIFDTCDNIKAMVAMAQAAGIKPMSATIPPWGPGSLAESSDPSPARYQRIDQLNQWIRQYGKVNQITVVDYWQALVSPDGETYIPSFTIDGVHPSVAGYDVMTTLVETAIVEQVTK